MLDTKFKTSLITEYLYSKLPQVYRDEDTNGLLKKFIEVFSEGGLTPLLNDTSNIMNLLDVDKCPTKYLPFLCSVYGYEYNLEIPELFQRRLLKHIVEMYKRKGTKSVVKFIARELTGFDSDITENKDFTDNQIEVTGWDKSPSNYRNFILRLTAPYEDSVLYNKEEIVTKVFKDFLPTNSQYLVITAFWFKEDSNFMETYLDSFQRDVVKDFTPEIHNNECSMDSSTSKLLEFVNYTHAWLGDEDSYLNDIYKDGLITNAYLSLRDTITLSVETYEEVVTPKFIYHIDFLKPRLEDLFYKITSTQMESRYDIMRIAEIDNSDLSNQMKVPNTNIVLNYNNGLYTNAISSWATIKELGEPDKVILL